MGDSRRGRPKFQRMSLCAKRVKRPPPKDGAEGSQAGERDGSGRGQVSPRTKRKRNLPQSNSPQRSATQRSATRNKLAGSPRPQGNLSYRVQFQATKEKLAGSEITPPEITPARTTPPHTTVGQITEAQRHQFLAALAVSSNISAAARAASIPASRLLGLRAEDSAFAAGWDGALQQGYDLLEFELLCRLREGFDADEEAATLRARKNDNATALKLLDWHRAAAAKMRTADKRQTAAELAEAIDRQFAEMRAHIEAASGVRGGGAVVGARVGAGARESSEGGASAGAGDTGRSDSPVGAARAGAQTTPWPRQSDPANGSTKQAKGRAI